MKRPVRRSGSVSAGAGELRAFLFAPTEVVFDVEEEFAVGEAELRGKRVGCFVETDFRGEGVVRSPAAAGGDALFIVVEERADAAIETGTAADPFAEAAGDAVGAAIVGEDDRGLRGGEVEFDGFETLFVVGENEALV